MSWFSFNCFSTGNWLLEGEKTERNKWKNAWWKLYYAMLIEECFECISSFICTLFIMSNKFKVGYVCFDPVICSVNVFLIAFWHLSGYQHSQRPVMQDWYQIDVSSGFYRIYIRKMTFLFLEKIFFFLNLHYLFIGN